MSTGGEQRRSGDDPGAHSRLEVVLYPPRDGLAPAVGVESLEVETELARPLPQMWVLQPPLVGEQGIVHLPETALERGRLGRAGRRPGSGMARFHRKVAEGEADRALAQAELERGTERTLEVRVLDDQRRVGRPADMIALVDRRRGRRAEIRQRSARRRSGSRPGAPPVTPPHSST
jgi:hypothetical protein